VRPVFILCALLIFSKAEGSIDTSNVEKSPSKAVLCSLIPGGGQIYNGKWIKAVLIVSSEAYVVYQFQKYRSLYNTRDLNEPESFKFKRYREKRNKYAWWVGLIYIYNLLDALVDSHLSTFDQIDAELQIDETSNVTDTQQNKESE
jgi:hypothetical protein